MTQTCPFCLESDLSDGAKRCFHCGSWLYEGPEADPREASRRDVREELRADLKEHRGLIETMLKRIQAAGGIIVAAALGAALFFGYTTDKSITETSDRISENAAIKIKAAAAQITETARQEVRLAVKEKLTSAETQAVIDEELKKTLTERVRTEVGDRIGPIRETIDKQIKSATRKLQDLDGLIANLGAESAKASERLAHIQASFQGAQEQTVESSVPLLPVDLIVVGEKGGADQLRDMLEQGVDALSYQLNRSYDGPMVWRYFDALKALPQFRHVLILSNSGDELVGILDAATLAAYLDPPNTAELKKRLGSDFWPVPHSDEVPQWNAFTSWLANGKLDRLRSLPSFRQAGEPVRRYDNSLEVLAVMAQRRADLLPVVDETGSFVGIVDRSRLTTRVLLKIAAPRG